MEVRIFLSLRSTSYVEFTSSKFSHKIHYYIFFFEYTVTRSVYLWQMHQSFRFVKTSRKDTLRIASNCGVNVKNFQRVSGITNTQVKQGDLTFGVFFPSSSLEGKVQKSVNYALKATMGTISSLQWEPLGCTRGRGNFFLCVSVE